VHEPPRFAEWLLSQALPRGLGRDSVLGDLRELYAARRTGGSRFAADIWYWRESLSLSLRYVTNRVRARAAGPSVWGAGSRTRRTFGNEWMQDIRHGVRGLRKNPGFAAIAIGTLALGIGVNAASFAFVDAAAFRPLPVRDATRLVAVFGQRQDARLLSFSYRDYEDYREGTAETFDGLAGFTETAVSLSSDGREAVMVWAHAVTTDYFDVVRPRVRLGRLLTGSDPAEVVLGHALWQRQFGADPGILGRTVRLNGHAFTVVGVAPPRFVGTRLWTYAPQLWVSMEALPAVSPGSEGWRASRAGGWLQLVGKLKPGISLTQATSAADAVSTRLGEAFAESHAGRTITLYANEKPVNPWAFSPGQIRSAGLISLAGVALVLLVACANVASLLLARGTSRRREVAVRLSLGASRARVARHLVTESLLIALAGGVVGLLVGRWLLPLLGALQPPLDFASAFEPALDVRVAAFTFVAALVSAVLAGALPAYRTSGAEPALVLRSESGGSGRAPRLLEGLVAAQVALSVVVLVAASLFTRSLARTQQIDPGFTVGDGLVLTVDPSLQGYSQSRIQQFYATLLDRIRAQPGVRSATRASRLPLDGSSSSMRVAAEGRSVSPDEQVTAWYYAVSPGFFDVLGADLVDGREFEPSDRAGSPPVAVISETLAQRLWPGASAVGQRIDTGGGVAQVVGVVSDFKVVGLRDGPQPILAVSTEQQPSWQSSLLIRTQGDGAALAPAVRRIVADLDPTLALIGLKTWADATGSTLAAARGGAAGAIGAGVLTLLLSMAGLYGVVAYGVARRAREIGIRMALGAHQSGVLALVIRRSIRVAMTGAAFGLILAVATGRLLSGLLFGVRPLDLPSFAAALIVLFTVALLAAWLPARRAARMDPLLVLRSE
jgi:predicted permease